jgi:ABC-type nitrate/sulfonate/bicarbonate transport system ATPase subunit
MQPDVPALEIRGVTRRFGAVVAVDGVDLDVPTGSFTSLLGPSGCGKTTLLRIVAGLERPDSGTVRLAGREVDGPAGHVPPEERRVGMVFQAHALFPHLDVARNIAFGLRGSDRTARAARVDEVLTLVTLPKLDWQQAKAAWFNALDSHGSTVRVETLERHALPAWIARRMAAQGQRVREGEEGERTLAFFADRVEGNLLAAHQEIMKLALLHPPGELGA